MKHFKTRGLVAFLEPHNFCNPKPALTGAHFCSPKLQTRQISARWPHKRPHGAPSSRSEATYVQLYRMHADARMHYPTRAARGQRRERQKDKHARVVYSSIVVGARSALTIFFTFDVHRRIIYRSIEHSSTSASLGTPDPLLQS